jgi:hypothetical protein
MFLGRAIAALCGVVLGLALGRSGAVLDYLSPLFAFARAVPPPLLVQLFLVLFDLGPPMQLAKIVVGVVWPVLLSSIDGAAAVDPVQVETARAFRLRRPDWWLSVRGAGRGAQGVRRAPGEPVACAHPHGDLGAGRRDERPGLPARAGPAAVRLPDDVDRRRAAGGARLRVQLGSPGRRATGAALAAGR